MIQEILEHPTARAIFIYPTKALAADQYRALQPWLSFFGPEKISAGVYDGDTPVNERKTDPGPGKYYSDESGDVKWRYAAKSQQIRI